MKGFNYLITGEICSGKDSAGEYFNGYIRKAFANNLKIVCRLIRIGDFEGAEKHLTYLFNGNPPCNMKAKLIEFAQTPIDGEKDRSLLQTLGTKWARKHYPDIWADAIKKELKPENKYLILDCRFLNEFTAFPDWKSIYIDCPLEIRKERAIKRDGCWNDDWASSPAEAEIRKLQDLCDYTVFNDSTLEDLKAQIEAILEFDNFVRGEVI